MPDNNVLMPRASVDAGLPAPPPLATSVAPVAAYHEANSGQLDDLMRGVLSKGKIDDPAVLRAAIGTAKTYHRGLSGYLSGLTGGGAPQVAEATPAAMPSFPAAAPIAPGNGELMPRAVPRPGTNFAPPAASPAEAAAYRSIAAADPSAKLMTDASGNITGMGNPEWAAEYRAKQEMERNPGVALMSAAKNFNPETATPEQAGAFFSPANMALADKANEPGLMKRLYEAYTGAQDRGIKQKELEKETAVLEETKRYHDADLADKNKMRTLEGWRLKLLADKEGVPVKGSKAYQDNLYKFGTQAKASLMAQGIMNVHGKMNQAAMTPEAYDAIDAISANYGIDPAEADKVLGLTPASRAAQEKVRENKQFFRAAMEAPMKLERAPVAARSTATPPKLAATARPPMAGARQAPDGKWYVSDPKRPGKYLEVRQ